jgi:metal-responsive CopG/Arc/MetJ family transcriptional regulator
LSGKEGSPMPARNPRVNVVLEKPLYEAVDHLAKEEGVSLSAVVRDLVKEAIEIREDIDLGRVAEAREKSLSRSRALSHKDIWG